MMCVCWYASVGVVVVRSDPLSLLDFTAKVCCLSLPSSFFGLPDWFSGLLGRVCSCVLSVPVCV